MKRLSWDLNSQSWKDLEEFPGRRNRYERHLRRIISEHSHSQLKVVNCKTFFPLQRGIYFPPLNLGRFPTALTKSVTSVPDQSLRELAASTWSLRALSRHVALLEILPERTPEEYTTRSRSRWTGAPTEFSLPDYSSVPRPQDRTFFFFFLNLPRPFENTRKNRSIIQQSSIGIPDSHVKNDKMVVVLSHWILEKFLMP